MKMKNLIIGFLIIISIIFLAMFFSITKSNHIEFTNLPSIIEEADQPTIGSNNPVAGSENPKVIVIEFGDLSNQTSISVAKSINTILEKYPDEMAVVWKDYPNTSLNPESQNVAIAGKCAQKQNVFWDFQNAILENSDILSNELYLNIAQGLDIWQWSFKRCLEKEKTLSLVQDDLEEAESLSLIAAPTIFINGEQFSGYISTQELERIILSAINQYE